MTVTDLYIKQLSNLPPAMLEAELNQASEANLISISHKTAEITGIPDETSLTDHVRFTASVIHQQRKYGADVVFFTAP